ncbi:MAG: hypothetical protein JWN87_1772 [Frankiales bacterium]|nr:hypothetical protein [Frankiales bacterium]MCW2585839.1 hypothetical protein [Frankiales bacterium]
MKRTLLVLPVLLATACGGGGSAHSGGVSKADYLQKAEAICKQANTDQKALKTPAGVDDLAPYVGKLVELADTATTQVVALEMPKADKAELDKKVLQPLKKQVVAGKAYAAKVTAAAKAQDQAELVKLLSSPPNGAKADLAWMRTYGFKECVAAADTRG